MPRSSPCPESRAHGQSTRGLPGASINTPLFSPTPWRSLFHAALSDPGRHLAFSLLLLFGFFGLFGLAPMAQSREAHFAHHVVVADLPPEAQRTLALIHSGGPFPYPRKDGSHFGNFEKSLPQQARAYYREYTVPTPGSRDRGPRRIIAGVGRSGDVATSGEYYYTDDHYRSFRRIRE
jgi:ribonuclease T1